MSATVEPQPAEPITAANLPERWEIVNGEPRPKEATGPRHGRAQGRAFRLLSPVVKMRLYHKAQVKHCWLIDPRAETLQVCRFTPDGYLFVLAGCRGETVRAEPFDAIELKIGIFFGEDEE